MRVHRPLAAAVRDGDEEAPAAVAPARPDDLARARRVDGRAHRSGEVDPGVPGVPARTEAVAQDGRGHGPAERQRDRRRWRGERAERRRSRDPVFLQACPALKAAQGGIDVRAEDPVELAGGKAVLRQLKLERGDVPTRLADLERPAAEPVAGEATEGLTRLRADDAVDREVGAGLEAADRLRGCGAGDPVDRTLVEPVRVQADLKGGNARLGRRGTGGEGRRGEDEGQHEERPDAHGRPFSSWRFGSLDGKYPVAVEALVQAVRTRDPLAWVATPL